MNSLRALSFLIVSAIAFGPNAASAATLDTAVESLCEDISQYLQGQSADGIFVEEFSGKSTNSAGRMLRLKIREGLKKMSLKAPLNGAEAATQQTKFKLVGSYFYSHSGTSHVVKLKGRIVDETTGEEHQTIQERIVDKTGDIAALLGLTQDAFSNEASNEAVAKAKTTTQLVSQQGEAIEEAVTSPSFTLVNKQVAAKASSPYRIEILRKGGAGFQPVDVSDLGGLAFAELQEGDVYAVRLVNDSDIDVGVELMIDALNSLRFSENASFKRIGRWLIPKRSSGVIRGWHKNGPDLYQFVVVPTPETALAELGEPTSTIGTITAAFFPAWPENEPPPAIESKLVGDATASGTGRGAVITDRIGTIRRRHGRTLLASVSVRYVNPEPPLDLPVQ